MRYRNYSNICPPCSKHFTSPRHWFVNIYVSLERGHHSVNRPSGHSAFTSSTTHRCKGVATTHAHRHYRNRRIPASTTGHPHARRRIVHSRPHTKASLAAAYTDMTHTTNITRQTELDGSTTCQKLQTSDDTLQLAGSAVLHDGWNLSKCC